MEPLQDVSLLGRAGSFVTDNAAGFFVGVAASIAMLLLQKSVALIWAVAEDFKSSRALIRPLVNPVVDKRFSTPDHWRGAGSEAQITVVVSGKGGVGKSTVALALAEMHSQSENVLLVDFDVHNRGLTSKLAASLNSAEFSTVYDELETFYEQYSKGLKVRLASKAQGRPLALTDISREDYQEFLAKYTTRPDKGPRKLRVTNLPERETRSHVRAKNIFFLPCRFAENPWIGTEFSRLDFVEVALFLRSLATIAKSSDAAITRIIVDCHGAHDMFAVGAIAVAERLVVVTTADPASFEGTAELVSFAKELAKRQDFAPEAEVLVVNDFSKATESRTLKSMLDMLGKDIADVPVIKSDPAIRRKMRSYAVPTARGIRHLWTKTVDIDRVLRKLGTGNTRIGQRLVDAKVLTNRQRNRVLRAQDNANPKRFGDIAVELGFCKAEAIKSVMEKATSDA